MGARFILLTSQRSGSAWWISMLNGMPDTRAYGELFLRRPRDPRRHAWDSGFARPRFVEREPGGPPLRPWSVFSYLDRLYEEEGTVGFKLMYSQLRLYPEILAYARLRGIRIVHLVRENHLDVLISAALKARVGVAHLGEGQAVGRPEQVALDTRTLVGSLRRLRRRVRLARRLLRRLDLEHLEVTYEELAKDRSSFDRIRQFLSIRPGLELPVSRLVKVRKGGHADVLLNYAEVKERLEGAGLAHLIEPPARIVPPQLAGAPVEQRSAGGRA